MKNLNDIKKKAKEVRNEFILINVGTILLGLFLVLFPGLSTDIICVAAGIFLGIWGLFKIIDYFKLRRNHIFGSFSMVQGCALLGFGIYILIFPQGLAALILTFLSLALLVTAVLKLQYAFDMLYVESATWWTQLVAAIIIAICGIIGLVNPFEASNMVMIFIGISFIVSGIWDLVTLIRFNNILSGVKKKVKNTKNKADKKSRLVDVEAEDKESDDE